MPNGSREIRLWTNGSKTTVQRAGLEKGHRQGYKQGEADLLLWLIEKKFGAESAQANRPRVEAAESETLRSWSERILSAETVDALFH